jgi:glutaminase
MFNCPSIFYFISLGKYLRFSAKNPDFRSVSMPLALALAMTEQSEKAIRQKIMQEKSIQSFMTLKMVMLS